MKSDLQFAVEAAKNAGALIRVNYSKAKNLTKKGINDYATETDLAAEELIINTLRRTGYSIFGEETGETGSNSDRKWIIDPLDGTTNFIRGFPFFCVSIALIEKNKKLILGVIYDPIHDECYWAEDKKGAYLNGKRISATKNSYSEVPMILIDHGWSLKSRKDYLQASKKLMEQKKAPPLMHHGTTALMLCYVAKGSAEAFLSCGDKIYDYAAGLIIVKEAGAIISDWQGNTWDNSSSYILACNPQLQPEVLHRISNIQQAAPGILFTH